MKERPILFSGPMVRAILEGRKTQTRRVIKLRKLHVSDTPGYDFQFRDKQLRWHDYRHEDFLKLCPHGAPGDRLWVRETWADVNTTEGPAIAYRANNGLVTWHEFSKVFDKDYGAGPSMNYKAYPGDYVMWCDDLFDGAPDHKWRPSIHMPRWASRITLDIKSVRVERLQDISEEDARAEGVEPDIHLYEVNGDVHESWDFVKGFEDLWESINGKDSWAQNPWVWVIEFEQYTKEGKGDE